jgi:hypothetical protein
MVHARASARERTRNNALLIPEMTPMIADIAISSR